jgi:phenylalanyl-tRNA synthetase beta subunit
MSLAIGVRTRQQGYTPKDDAHLKEKLSVLEVTLGTTVNAVIETGVLECNLSSLIASFVVPTTYDPIMEQHGCIFAPYSTYPFVSRDIALWVPETQTAHDVESLIRTHSGSLLISVRLFDEFKKDTQISYAFRLIFQAMDRTLTDEEVGNIMKDIVDVCQKQGYTVR